ncbi:LysE family translocator [Prosthecomicrobium pneumaticum]|uniref:Threonine/homoserine/homoserine lactone efflux protein n=1 Tax=Prosthecomicrobium pneumaticum TaxID=81895 RepID=A0A7W9FPH2_9HYPH|nr:LysE family translocator [Prosthecomicrobium pneumaticum]MBB5754482.1 threonine/homoserine/homoserine lactone efflux protein [Prosthecomicrobium pneumaticum]
MPSLELLAAFAAATLLFAFFPGPALLYTAAQTLARGRRAGLMAVLGIHTGCYAHVLAATLGLSAVLTHVPEAYLALKLAGAVYLCWMGVQMIRSKAEGAAAPQVAVKSARRAFVESVLVELLNPKAALFFVAFLPQFVDPAAGLPVWAQFLILGVVVNLTFSFADIVTVFAASTITGRLRRSGRAMRAVRYLGGSVLVALGARLAMER